MSLATSIAKFRLHYHANLVDIGNALNQLGLMKDDTAEEFCKKHTFAALESGARMHGMSLEEVLKKFENES